MIDVFGDRPNVRDRPDDVLFSDDLVTMKSMVWTFLTMSTPKGGALRRAPQGRKGHGDGRKT
jgi:hypothetical protein